MPRLLLLSLGLSLFACATTRSTEPKRQVAVAPAPPPPPVFQEGSGVPDATLRDAIEEKVGAPEMGPAEVVKSWTWRPRGKQSYVVWVTCRGQGFGRTCTLAVASPGGPPGGKVFLVAHETIGWSSARARLDGDRAKVRIDGENGGGTWSEALELLSDGSLKLGEKSYPTAR